MSEALRERMCGAAVKLAKAVGYAGAGTVEFLVEGGTLGPDAKWYFIEMNTRLQVEHPVTEEITGLDLVEWQLRVASGEKLPLAQGEIRMHGHAIEARLCAEDPAKGFLPSVGQIEDFTYEADGTTRIESGVQAGSVVSPFYDSMVAKIIEAQPTREACIDALREALQGGNLWGLQTNAAFLDALLADPLVREGAMDTGLIGRELERLTAVALPDEVLAASALAFLQCESELAVADAERIGGAWDRLDGFQLGGGGKQTVKLAVDGEVKSFELERRDGLLVRFGEAEANEWPDLYHSDGLVHYGLREYRISRPTYDATSEDDGNAGDTIRAPINGKVARVFVTEGQAVAKGDRVAVVEAMKMEHVLVAGRDGTISKVAASEGAQVNQGALIASLAEV
jgi:3-methylcrotonyl-CoA carboxylase alpha subunit